MIDGPDVEFEAQPEVEAEEDTLSFSCSSRCIFIDSDCSACEDFEGKLELYGKKLVIYDNSSSPLELKYEDILEVSGVDYQIKVLLDSGDKVILMELGYDFEDFLKRLALLYNEFIIENLPMNDAMQVEFEGEYIHLVQDNLSQASVECKIRICNKSLLIISPEKGPLRIPYSLISKASKSDYQFLIDTDYNESFILKGLGGELDNLENHLNAAIGRFSSKMQTFIKSVMPRANSLSIRKASNLMKDGRVVKLADIKAMAPELLKALEERISECNSTDRYNFITSLSYSSLIHTGLKKGQTEGFDSDYIWTLSPLLSQDRLSPGNILVMEVLAPEKEGKATYFFRIMPWKDYETLNVEQLKEKINHLIKLINKCMIFVDFKREPIYISQSKLEAPENLKYRIALSRLPELSLLRELYIGRVVHSSEEQWKRDVNSLVEFAYNERKDNRKWKR